MHVEARTLRPHTDPGQSTRRCHQGPRWLWPALPQSTILLQSRWLFLKNYFRKKSCPCSMFVFFLISDKIADKSIRSSNHEGPRVPTPACTHLPQYLHAPAQVPALTSPGQRSSHTASGSKLRGWHPTAFCGVHRQAEVRDLKKHQVLLKNKVNQSFTSGTIGRRISSRKEAFGRG